MQTVSIIQLEKTRSTNTYLKHLLRQASAPAHGTVVWAKQQTAGRGKGMRSWIADHNSICFSLLLTDSCLQENGNGNGIGNGNGNGGLYENAMEVATVITQLAALAVCEAMSELGIDCRIKWPNDVLVEKCKLCGILVDLASYPSSTKPGLQKASPDQRKNSRAFVVGIGINAYHQAHELDELYRAISAIKAEAGATLPPASIFHQLQNYNRRKNSTPLVSAQALRQEISGKKLIETIGNTCLAYFASYRKTMSSCEKVQEAGKHSWSKKWLARSLLANTVHSKKIDGESCLVKIIGISPSGELLFQRLDKHDSKQKSTALLSTMKLMKFNSLP